MEYYNLPIKNTRILGITTLWMLIPILISNSKYNLLKYSLSCCCLFSTIFWFKPKDNSLFHNLDRLSAYIYLFILLYTSYNTLNHYLLILLLINILIFYSLSYYYFYKDNHDYQLICHLLFRYFFYMWSHFVLIDYNIIIITIGYISHIYLIYNEKIYNEKNINFTSKEVILEYLYVIYCIISIVIIFITYNIYNLLHL